MTIPTLDEVGELAQQLRVDSIRCSTAAGSGHPTSSMSAADVMAVLLARYLRYDWERPDDPANDPARGIGSAVLEAFNEVHHCARLRDPRGTDGRGGYLRWSYRAGQP